MKNKKQKYNPYDTPNTRKVMGDYYVEMMGYLLGCREDVPILKLDLCPKPKIYKQTNKK